MALQIQNNIAITIPPVGENLWESCRKVGFRDRPMSVALLLIGRNCLISMEKSKDETVLVEENSKATHDSLAINKVASSGLGLAEALPIAIRGALITRCSPPATTIAHLFSSCNSLKNPQKNGGTL